MPRRLLRPALVLALLAGIGSGIGLLAASAQGVRAAGGLQVVAAESSWGSLAAQLGGHRAHVTSVIANPAADPHDYEPTAADARAVAEARLVVENGIGYDPWAAKLVAADATSGRLVLDVGDLVGVRSGGNPHRWYSPGDVRRVIRALTAAYVRLDPAHASYFRAREVRLEQRGLRRYRQLLAAIARRYRGVAVGASESLFAPLAQALGLTLVTPPTFLRATSEGADPSAADLAEIERQVDRRQIAAWLFDSQNSTPDVARITAAARAKGIPVVAITETLSPASATFQSWQVRQLRALAAALARGTGG